MDGAGAEAGLDLFFRETVHTYVQARRFIRRDWLAREIVDAVADSACRMLLVTGEPGSGKSGVLAQLSDENPDWPVYFIRRDQRSSLSAASARAVLLRVGFQLAVGHPELFSTEQVRVVVEQRIGDVMREGSAVAVEAERILSSPFHQTVLRIQQEVTRSRGAVTGLRVHEWVADPRMLKLDDLATMALLDPAASLRRADPDARIVVLLDALDEVPYQPEEETLLSWLAGVELPDNVRFVLTSRPEPLLGTLVDRQADRLLRLEIASADRRVRRDLTEYARQLAAGRGVAAALTSLGLEAEGFVGRAVDKADGNIGYLDALGRAVDQTFADVTVTGACDEKAEANASDIALAELLALDRLPEGLDNLYAFFLRQLRTGPGARLVRVDDPATGASGRAEAWTELYHPMLEVLSVALEPLTAAQLSGLIGALTPEADTSAALQRLGQFLDGAGGRYRLYHATLSEFLHSERTRQNPDTAGLAVDAVSAHRRIAARLRDDVWIDVPEQPAEQGRREYGRRNYVAHLYHAMLWDELFAVLDSGSHGRHRVAADPSTREFWAKLEFGLRACTRHADDETVIARLPRLWRYAILRHGLARNADDQSVDALAAHALLGHAEQAAGLAELISDPRRRSATCQQLATLLVEYAGTAADSARFADLARRAIDGITDSAEQAETLGELITARIALSDAGLPTGVEERAELEVLVRAVKAPIIRTARLAEFARLIARDGEQPEFERVLDEIGDVTWVAEEDLDDVLLILTETFADCGATAPAGEALDAIRNIWHLIAAVATLAGYEGAAEDWPSLPERMEEAEAAAMHAPLEVRCTALTRLAPVWRQLGEGDRMLGCVRAAADAFATLPEPPPEVAGELIAELRAAGADDLRTATVAQVTEAAVRSIHYQPPGYGYAFNTSAQDAAWMLASAGEPDAAQEVARHLLPMDRPTALEPVVAALATSGRWDEAIAVIVEIESYLQLRAPNVMFGASPLLSGADQAERGWYRVAVALSEAGEPERALDAARRIRSALARCAALGAVARHYAETAQRQAAAAVLAEHDRNLRVNAVQPGRMVAVPAAARLLVTARAWQAAMSMLDTIRAAMGVFAWHVLGPLSGGLLADGRRELARQVIDGLEPVQRVPWLVRWAEAADPDAREAALAAAEQTVEQIDNPAQQADALDEILRARVDLEPEQAATLLRRAIATLNPIEEFRFRPTPWTRVAADLLLVGDPAAALDLAGRLPPDDAAIALCEIAKAAQRIGTHLDMEGIVDAAARAAATVDSPMRSMVDARVAVEYARLGLLERADRAAAASPEARRAVTEHLAQSGRVGDGLRILGKELGQGHTADTEQAIVAALLASGDFSEAERVARAVQLPGPRAELLAQVARSLAPHADADAQRLAADALRVLARMDHQFDAERIEKVATALAETGQTGLLLETIRHEWLVAGGLEALAARLGLASPLVRNHAAVAAELASSFDWVDDFLCSLGEPEFREHPTQWLKCRVRIGLLAGKGAQRTAARTDETGSGPSRRSTARGRGRPPACMPPGSQLVSRSQGNFASARSA